MKLVETIKEWFNSSDKNRLEKFDIESIEEIIEKVKNNPFLHFMQVQIEVLLYHLCLSAKKGNEGRFIVVNGVAGSGKTNFLYEHLQGFLHATGIINNKKIVKIASHNLSDYELKGRKPEEVIFEKLLECKDGILIIDEFTTKDINAQKIADLVNNLSKDSGYQQTVIILIGEHYHNSAFIENYKLEQVFLSQYHLDFYIPSCSQITDIFENYAKREGNFNLTESAKSRLNFYFYELKVMKETKTKLNRQMKMKFPYKERNFSYTSEILPVYKEIVENLNNKTIDQQDVLNTNCFIRLINDRNKLKSYLTLSYSRKEINTRQIKRFTISEKLYA